MVLYLSMVKSPPLHAAGIRAEFLLPAFGILLYRYSALLTDIVCLHVFHGIAVAKGFYGVFRQMEFLGNFHIAVAM